MAPHAPYRTGRLLLNGIVAGVLAGSTASVLSSFEIVTRVLRANWAGIVEAAGAVFGIATPAGLVGGALYGLLAALAARPLARLGERMLRRILFTAIFAVGFVALAVVGLATGVPPLTPLSAILIVAAALACAWWSFPGFDREVAEHPIGA